MKITGQDVRAASAGNVVYASAFFQIRKVQAASTEGYQPGDIARVAQESRNRLRRVVECSRYGAAVRLR